MLTIVEYAANSLKVTASLQQPKHAKHELCIKQFFNQSINLFTYLQISKWFREELSELSGIHGCITLSAKKYFLT